jgi:hypothetical protein
MTMMDIVMAMAMDGLSAMQWQWPGDSDGRCDGDGDERCVGNSMTMDELLAVQL